MATRTIPVTIVGYDSGVFEAAASTQMTTATAPSLGDVPLIWISDGGADRGVRFTFRVPGNYVGSPRFVPSGVLDGAPGASDVLGWTARKRVAADNGAADGTYDAEQTGSASIGSGGSGHSDEDAIIDIGSITLTAGDFVAGRLVFGQFQIDSSVNNYAGQVGLAALEFEYSDT